MRSADEISKVVQAMINFGWNSDVYIMTPSSALSEGVEGNNSRFCHIGMRTFRMSGNEPFLQS